MRKWTFLGSLMAVLMAGAYLMAYAKDSQKGPACCAGMMCDMGGGGMMGHGMDKLKDKLGLTDDQATKMKDLFKNHMEETQPLRDQMKVDMDTLRLKVHSKASDGEIKKLLDTLSADRDKMESGRKTMEKKVREILNPTQQAKFLVSMRDRGMGMMGKRMGQRWDKDGKGMKGRSKGKSDKDGDEKDETNDK